MAKTFLVPINMGGLEIQSFLVHNLPKASEPTGAEGQIYADTTNNYFMYHDGTAWRQVLTSNDEIALTSLGSYADGSIIIGGAADWTTLSAGSQGYVLTMGTNRPEWSSPGAPAAHDILGTAHNRTVSKATPDQGDFIVANASNNWEAFAIGSANDILSTDGSDPIWSSRTELNLASYTGATTDETIPKFTATTGQIENGYTVETTLTGGTGALVRADAIKTYIDNAVSTEMTYKGGYNASTNTPDLDTSPSGVEVGDMYTVTVAGTFFTTAVSVGDVIIAEVDDADQESEWTIVEATGTTTFLGATDTPSSYSGTAGYMVMVDSTPDALEFVNPATYNLSNFNDNLSYENPLSFSNGINRSVNAISLDLGSLSTSDTAIGDSDTLVIDDGITKSITWANVKSQITSAGYTKKYTGLIGTGAATQIDVTHGLGTQYVTAQVFNESTNEEVICDIDQLSGTQTRFTFASAPASNALRVVIIG